MTYVSESFWHDAVNKATTDLFTFGYKHIVKPNFVFNHTPDVAHDQMIEFCRVTGNIPPLMWLLREMLNYTDPVLETSVMGVDFANPFGLSAGLDKNCDMPVLMDNAGFGFETVGSTTSRPCAGNPKPWFHRLPEYDSMMVHVGLANDGSDKVIARAEQAWTKARSLQVSVSIARTNDDLGRGHRRRHRGLPHLAGTGGRTQRHGGDQRLLPQHPRRRAVHRKPREPRPPVLCAGHGGPPAAHAGQDAAEQELEEFRDLLAVLAEHNVQGVSIANLQKDRTGLEIPRDWEGGLSGGPTYRASNELVRRTYREFGDRFAIAGIGGVFTPEQAYAKIRSGASLVMFISSLMYRGPQQITVLKRGLASLLKRDGFEHVSEAVGIDA